MVSKIFLATLVISLGCLSEAVFFKDRFPGKTLADLARCQDGYKLVGMRETRRTYKFAPKNGKQCAKYCLKQLLAGEKKDNDNKNIVGSMFKASQCICVRYNEPRFVEETGTFSCVFSPPVSAPATPATCEPAITSLVNGEVSCTDSNNEGSTCTLTCDDGYTCGSDTLHVHESTCTNGEWDSKPVEECIPISCAAESLELTDGVASVNCEQGASGKDTDYKSRCTFTCKDGYSFENENAQMIRCTIDGDNSDGTGAWYGSTPKCEKDEPEECEWGMTGENCDEDIVCAEVDEVANATPMDCTSGTTMIAQSCTLMCEDGYELVGNDNIFCDIVEGKGVFTSTFGECKEKAAAATPLCSDATWLQAGYAQGEDNTGDGYSAWTGGEQNSQEACYQKCIEMTKTYPDINAIGYAIEGRRAKTCSCYPASTGFKGEWKASDSLGYWGTNSLFCMMPEAEEKAAEEAATPLCSDSTWLEALYAEGEPFPGDNGYQNKYAGKPDSKEACYQSCIKLKETHPEINGISYGVEGIDAKSCGCFPSVTSFEGKWKPTLGDWDTNRVFCMMPEVTAAAKGEFSEWGSWEECSTSCGEGTQSRSRTCDGENCEGDATETETCTMYKNCDSCAWVKKNSVYNRIGNGAGGPRVKNIASKEACEVHCLQQMKTNTKINVLKFGHEGYSKGDCTCVENAVELERDWTVPLSRYGTNNYFCWLPDYNGCYTRPCQQGASCTDQADGYFCDCPKGYTGKNCEFPPGTCGIQCAHEERWLNANINSLAGKTYTATYEGKTVTYSPCSGLTFGEDECVSMKWGDQIIGVHGQSVWQVSDGASLRYHSNTDKIGVIDVDCDETALEAKLEYAYEGTSRVHFEFVHICFCNGKCDDNGVINE